MWADGGCLLDGFVEELSDEMAMGIGAGWGGEEMLAFLGDGLGVGGWGGVAEGRVAAEMLFWAQG